MRKTILALCVLCTAPFFSQAQLRVAITGGAHLSTVIETNNLTGWDTISPNYSGRLGFHGGFSADIPFSPTSKLFFQPGVIYYNKGRKFDQVSDTTQTIIRRKSEQFVNYVDIPLNLVLKFGSKTKIIIGGGPYVSFFFSGKETGQTYTRTGIASSTENADLPVGKMPGQYQVVNYGVHGLIGLESGRFFITGNYSRGLNDFYKAIDYTGTFKHQVIGGSVGIYLGKSVEIVKKPKDKDKDGIPDTEDECPDQAGPAVTHGCPDKDADGIADKNDQCPDQPGTVANHGCPVVDTDKDGVNDKDDKCPTVPGLPKYKGCPPPDTDGDGVNDEEDKCPALAGIAKYQGCPVPDTDGDGVNDEMDKCPAVAGLKERNGCPPEEIKQEIIEKVNYAARRIQFQSGKSILLPSSLKELDAVAVLLKEHTDLLLDIEGHTSADGSAAFNQKLSEDRAAAVKKYLVLKGINENRLSAKGYGPSQPLVPGTSSAARAQNRRVEMKLRN